MGVDVGWFVDGDDRWPALVVATGRYVEVHVPERDIERLDEDTELRFSRQTHRLLMGCGVGHAVLCGIVAAFTDTWVLWLAVACPAVAVPGLLARFYPEALLTRLAMAVGFMAMTGLIIEQSGGDQEAHFSFFVMISFLVAYHDWRPLVCAALCIFVHHLAFSLLQPAGWGFYVWNDGRGPWGHLSVHVGAATVQTLALCYVAGLLQERFRLRTENVALQHSLQAATTRADYDSLTGLFNRRYLDRVVRQMSLGPPSGRRRMGLCMLDLDHFKQLNDSFGHAAGDEVLRDVCALIRQQLGSGDCAVRYGGEEVLILQRDVREGPGNSFAESLRLRLETHRFATCAGTVGVTASLGVAIWRETEPFADAFGRADLAVYRAKNSGRNRVVVDLQAEETVLPKKVLRAFEAPTME